MTPLPSEVPAKASISHYAAHLWANRRIVVPVFLVAAVGLSYLLVYKRAWVTEAEFKIMDVPENSEVLVSLLGEIIAVPENANLVGQIDQIQPRQTPQKQNFLNVKTIRVGNSDPQELRRFLEVTLIPSTFKLIKNSESPFARRVFRRRQVELEGELNLLRTNEQIFRAKIAAVKAYLATGQDHTDDIQPPALEMDPGTFGYMSQVNILPIKSQLSLFELALVETNQLIETANKKIHALDLLANHSKVPDDMKALTKETLQEIYFKITGKPNVTSVTVATPSAFKILRNGVFVLVASILIAAATMVAIGFAISVKRNYLALLNRSAEKT